MGFAEHCPAGTLRCGHRMPYKKVYRLCVTQGLKAPLLGKPAIEDLNVLDSLYSVRDLHFLGEFPNLFQNLCNSAEEYEVRFVADAPPFAFSLLKRVLIPFYKNTKYELDHMQRLGVFSPVEELTNWCAPVAVVLKSNGRVRICAHSHS